MKINGIKIDNVRKRGPRENCKVKVNGGITRQFLALTLV